MAAIPAVVMYNMFSRWIAGYRALHADAAAEILRLISRDLDRGAFDHRPAERRRPRQRPSRFSMSVRLDHGDEELSELHEINVTPFIDVILVLLIIFMIAAPLATVDISVDLPAANAEPSPAARQAAVPDAQIGLEPDARQRCGEPRRLARRSTRRPPATSSSACSCAPTRSVPYGELMTLMNELRSAGYLHVALVGLEAEKLSP